MALVAMDLDGTLVDQAAAAREWAGEFVAQWHLPDSAADDITAQLTQRSSKGQIFDAIAAAWSLPTSGTDLWGSYRRRMPELTRCPEENRQALRELRRAGWTLGIVTNGMTDNQEGKIRSTGIAELVDGWVVSDSAGYRKPQPEIFFALADRLACAIDGWMVGDSLEHDVAGGTAVGLMTALIEPSESAAEQSAIRPTIRVPSFTAAAAAILAGPGVSRGKLGG